MKKNYFMLVCLVLLSAFSVKAQVATVADLFGNYKFTATVAFESEEYKNSYGNVLVNESDVTIQKGGDRDGVITGFVGSENPMYFDFSDNAISIFNPNYNLLWSNSLMLADADANNPYGIYGTDGWTVMPLELNYTFNPETKEITVPDFTVIHMYQYKDATTNKMVHEVTHIATYTNVKMAYVGSNEPDVPAFDWVGTYTFNGTACALDEKFETVAADESLYPSTFEVVVEFIEATEYTDEMYVVTSFMGRDVSGISYDGGIKLTIASDGKSATLANGCVESLGGDNFLKLFDINGAANPIKITLNDDGSLSMADFSVVSGAYESSTGNMMVCWYEDNTLTKGGSGADTSAFSWVGQHTVKVGEVEAYDGKTYPTEFTMTVIEDAGKYLVTEFLGNDVTELNWGGIAFTVAADGKSAEMTTGAFVGGVNPDYWVIYDMNASDSPVRFILNDDGSVAIDNFCIKNYNYDSNEESLAALFKDVTIPAAGGETVEPETPAFDWAGTYVFKGTPGAMDGSEYPAEFEVEVTFYEANEYQDASYCVTSFMGEDVNAINYGGIELTIAEDGKSATLANGIVKSLDGGLFLKLFDMNAAANPIAITLNEDGTLSMKDFSIVSGAWNDNENNELVAWYQNNTLEKGELPEEPETPEVDYTPTNTGTRTYTERNITAIKLTSPAHGESRYSLDSSEQLNEYLDLTGKEAWLVAAPGEEVTVEVVTGGSWVNHYVYVDYDANGFTAGIAEGSEWAPTGDLVSYSLYNNGGASDETGCYNSVGASISGTSRSNPALPAFTVASETGEFRMRIKQDWCSIDPMGDSDSNFGGTFSNYGGQIIDIKFVVTTETAIEEVKGENVKVKGIYDLQGRKVEQITAPGLYIVNGKKVLVK